MTTFFSAATSGFYSEELRAAYDAAGTWPSDAIEIDAGLEATLRAALAVGATIEYLSGDWSVTPPPAIPFSEIAAPRLASFRQNREIALNRLSGIGFAALLAADADHAREIAAVRNSLLGIPSIPAVRDALTLPDLDAALDAAWLGAYVGGESTEIATAMAVGAGGGQTRPT